eukprot:GFKZ01001628.1.p1 GENE.GFKZ01001628.1~~GFKZ01001628.1.p1  ORF type:complete len:757 (+),score=63.79 GFKZ01001628.1:361-2631(+)
MDIDSAVARYLRNPEVARWLFSNEEIRTVSAEALDASFVYAIGWGMCPPGTPRSMNIEDMLIVTGQVGTFVLGYIWGLSQPHVFARTPLMLDRVPLARRFAVDFSRREALEFMEFVTFDDGKVVVMFRQFLHTHDLSLPCVACARLHASSKVEQTLGPLLMRADLFEAACCPACGQVGKGCRCSFDSYAPNSAVRRVTHTWNQFSGSFMRKARLGTIKLRMTAVLPNVGELTIMDNEIPVVNVLQKGDTEYMRLMRRKAVHGLGVNVVMPRADAWVLAQSVENDFIDLHNSFVTRKRIREEEGAVPGASFLEASTLSDVPVLEDPPTFDEVLSLPKAPVADQIPSSDQADSLDQLSPLDDLQVLDQQPMYNQPLTLDLTQNGLFGAPSNVTCSDSVESVDDILSVFPGILTTETSPNDQHAIKKGAVQLEEITSPDLAHTFGAKSKHGVAEATRTHDGSESPSIVPSSSSEPEGQVRRRDDILNDIELILSPVDPKAETGVASLSPQGSQTEAISGIPLKDPPFHMLSEPTGSHQSLWDSVVMSTVDLGGGHGAKVAATAGERSAQNGSTESSSKRAKTTARRSNRRFTSGNSGADSEKKHACTTCSSRFKMRGDLLRHVKIVHEGRKMYSCDTCGKSFGHSGHLNRHISSVHLQQRRFKCQFCGFQFFQASHLQSHIGHIHGAKKAFGCKDCGYRASSHAALKAHRQEAHPKVGKGDKGDMKGCRRRVRGGTELEDQQDVNRAAARPGVLTALST